MTAWVKRGTREEIGVVTDFVDLEWVLCCTVAVYANSLLSRLTEFNRQLIDSYLDIPSVDTECGYACSDQYVDFFHDYCILNPFVPAPRGPKLATRRHSALVSIIQISHAQIPF